MRLVFISRSNYKYIHLGVNLLIVKDKRNMTVVSCSYLGTLAVLYAISAELIHVIELVVIYATRRLEPLPCDTQTLHSYNLLTLGH